MTELTDIREAFARGESAALDSGWLCNEYLNEHIAATGADYKMEKRKLLHELHEMMREEGIAYSTILDRTRVTGLWTRELCDELPVKFGYHHLRGMYAPTIEQAMENYGKVLDYITENNGMYPKVEEVSDIVNGREAIPIYEKRRMAFVKQARKIYATDPDAQWRAAAELIIARDAADGGTWDSDK
jgi:hypothetical protein